MLNMTTPEAEAMLGRPLTWMEGTWLYCSRGYSDYFLYCLTFFILCFFYTVVSLGFTALDLLRLPFFEQFRIQKGVYNSKTATYNCFKAVMTVFFTTILPLQVCSYPFFQVAGIHGNLPLPTAGELVLQLAVFFIVEDYGNYWIHRWLHSEWAYKTIHYMHHEFTTPMSFAASYAHPLEVLLLGVPSFVGPAIVQCHVLTLWAWIVLRQVEALETHSGYDFPWWPTKLIPFYGGSEFHDYHHFIGGKSRGNFASVFTYCDWLYGTDKGYRFVKELELGKKNSGKKSM